MQVRRKAISPVLATVILIAITLIAAVAIAGFVFGLFGSFQNVPQMKVQVVNCSTSSCTLVIQNSGSAVGAITGTSTNSSTLSVAVPAQGQKTLHITNLGLTAGQTFTGFLLQGNGPNLYYTATVG